MELAAHLADPNVWSRIAAVVAVNLLLSGDNAVVIALACRDLPPAQQRRAMALGSAVAVVVLVLLTMAAAFVLSWPAVKLGGALLLGWVAVKLLVPEGDGNGGLDGHDTLFAAIRTIVLADVVMSLDNVLAVAAAAHGEWWLMVVGLLLSVPVIIFGSGLIIRLVSRFPLLVTGGAALLGWLAGEMALAEPLIEPLLDHGPQWPHRLVPAVAAAAVVIAGKALAARRLQPALVVCDDGNGDGGSDNPCRREVHPC